MLLKANISRYNSSQFPLPLHEFHDIAIRLLNHCDTNQGANLFLRHNKVYALGLKLFTKS